MNVIYIRTSTTEQNPQNQLKDITSMFEGEYKLFEEKVSAFNQKERVVFEKLISEIKEGNISNLYVWDLDRLYRNRIKLKEFLQLCNVYHCKVWSYRQKFINQIQELNLPNEFEFLRDMMLNNLIEMLGWIAEDESRRKSDRVKIATRKKGDKTYSYKGNKWGRKTISSQKKNKIKVLRDEGKSIRDISNELELSIGVVHKYITQITKGKNNLNEVFKN